MAIIKVRCANCGHEYMTDDCNLTSICPLCKKELNVKESLMNDIDDIYNQEFLTPLDEEKASLLECVKRGNIYLKNKDFNNLIGVYNLMCRHWPSNFWTYCFRIIIDTEIDFTKPFKIEHYVINESEMQEDLKARIYHKARQKYAASSQTVFDGISKFYPDLPNPESSGEQWIKSSTIFDMKMDNLIQLKEKNDSIIKNYLPQMIRTKSTSGEEQIVKNIQSYSDSINKCYEEMISYNKEADDFVQKDYEKTTKPGNKPLFFMYLINFIVSIGLVLLGISNYIIGSFIGYDSLFAIVTDIVSIIIFTIMTTYFLFKKKVFSKDHPLIVLSLIIINIIFVIFGFVACFTLRPGSVYQILVFWGLMIGITATYAILSVPYLIKFRPTDTYANNTYIGNYQALVKNDFKVDFEYKFNSRG